MNRFGKRSAKPFDSKETYRNSEKTNNHSIMENTIQKENEEYLSDLLDSAKEIKRISIGIREQVTSDIILIDNVDENLTKSHVLMKKTINKLDELLNSKAGNIIFYTVVFIILVFMILYKLI